jgi:hypothetical protein
MCKKILIKTKQTGCWYRTEGHNFCPIAKKKNPYVMTSEAFISEIITEPR